MPIESHLFSDNSSIWLLDSKHCNPGWLQWLHSKVRFFSYDRIMGSGKGQVFGSYCQISDALVHLQDFLSLGSQLNLEQPVD